MQTDTAYTEVLAVLADLLTERAALDAEIRQVRRLLSPHRSGLSAARRAELESRLRENSVDGTLLPGTPAMLNREFGLTRERVRQIAKEIGLTGVGHGHGRTPIASPVYLACGSCGTRPVFGWRQGGTLCIVCSRVPVMCDYCGIVIYQPQRLVLRNAREGRGLKSNRRSTVQCNRAGRKRCPRGPVMFALQLGPVWQRAWICGLPYIEAAVQAAYQRGFKVARELREDGYWMRRVG